MKVITPMAPFEKVKTAKALNSPRRVCAKCGAKVIYTASICGDNVCKKCYGEFRKQLKKEISEYY